jgi:hypothetical protein
MHGILHAYTQMSTKNQKNSHKGLEENQENLLRLENTYLSLINFSEVKRSEFNKLSKKESNYYEEHKGRKITPLQSTT